jgi:hypothetical protein
MAIESLRICKLTDKPITISRFGWCWLEAAIVAHAVSAALRRHAPQAHDRPTCIGPLSLVEWTTLPVDFPEDNVERAENCRYISKHVSFAQKVHCLEVSVGRCADLAFVWLIGSI